MWKGLRRASVCVFVQLHVLINYIIHVLYSSHLRFLLSLIWRCHHFKNNLIGESQLSEFVQLLSNCIIYKLYSSHSRFFLHSYRYVTITGGFKFWSTLDTHGHGAVRVLYRATFTVTLGIRLYKCYIRWLITLTRTTCRAFGNGAVTTFLMT